MNSEAPIPIESRYLGLNRESSHQGEWGVITFNTRGPGAGPIPLRNSNTHKYFFRREKVDLTCKVYRPETICLIQMDGKNITSKNISAVQVQILSRFYPDFTLFLSRFFRNSLYPNSIWIKSR